jgi:outer membrane lipopolysaccharide assembly protein LptE/RlpB
MIKKLTILIAAAVILLLSGCGLFNPSPEEVLDSYFSDVKAGNWTNLWTYMHPDMAIRDTLKNGTTLATEYDDGQNNLITFNITSSSDLTYTVSVYYPSDGSSTSETFIFEPDGGVFGPKVIRSFTARGTTYN